MGYQCLNEGAGSLPPVPTLYLLPQAVLERSPGGVPYKRVISNLEGNFERFQKYGLIPSLLKFSDLHTVLIVVSTLMVTFK